MSIKKPDNLQELIDNVFATAWDEYKNHGSCKGVKVQRTFRVPDMGVDMELSVTVTPIKGTDPNPSKF